MEMKKEENEENEEDWGFKITYNDLSSQVNFLYGHSVITENFTFIASKENENKKDIS